MPSPTSTEPAASPTSKPPLPSDDPRATARGHRPSAKPADPSAFRRCLGRDSCAAKPEEARTRREPTSPPSRAACEVGAPFQVEPGVLMPPMGRVALATPHAGARVASESAVLIERYVESIRVGRAGDAKHTARVRVAATPGAREATEVRIEVVEGRVRATVLGDGGPEARSLARRIADELSRRGVGDAEVEVE